MYSMLRVVQIETIPGMPCTLTYPRHLWCFISARYQHSSWAHQSFIHFVYFRDRLHWGLVRWNIWFGVMLFGLSWPPREATSMAGMINLNNENTSKAVSRGSARRLQEVWLLLTPEPQGDACPSVDSQPVLTHQTSTLYTVRQDKLNCRQPVICRYF